MNRRKFLIGLTGAVIAAPMIGSVSLSIEGAKVDWHSQYGDYGHRFGVALTIDRPGDLPYRQAMVVRRGSDQWPEAEAKVPDETVRQMKKILLDMAQRHLA